MIRGLAMRIPPALAAIGGSRRSRVERAEARLELACTWGAGHLLVTGADRADVRDLLERVLRRIDPLGTVRARACSPDPESALDGLFSLCEGNGPIPLDRRERRQVLLRLLARARAARRSVFIVVDDGDDATVAELERLRAGVEIAPEAIERLRLVLLGGPALVAKLEDRAARALSSRITSRIRLETGRRYVSPARSPQTPVRPSLAIAAGASVALLAYGATRIAFAPERIGSDAARLDVRAGPSSYATASVATPAVQVRTGLRGDEPFLGGALRIPVHAKWTTGSALFPPPPPPAETSTIAVASAQAPTEPAVSDRGVAAVAAARPPAPVKVAAELAAGTSIAALVARFR